MTLTFGDQEGQGSPITLGNAAYALIDQGSSTVTNFTLGLMLARAVSKDEYAIFGVVQGVLQLAYGFHQAFVTEPFSLYALSAKESTRNAYARRLFVAHALAGVISVGLGVLALGTSPHLQTIAAASAYGICVASLYFVRNYLYAQGRAAAASLRGLAYTSLWLLCLIALYWSDQLTLAHAQLTAAIILLPFVLWTVVEQLRLPVPQGTRVDVERMRREHWRYGRVACLSIILIGVSQSLNYFLLPSLAAPGVAAEFRAQMNVLLPFLQAVSAIGLLLFGALKQRPDRTRVTTRRALTLMVAPAIALIPVLWLFGGPITGLINGPTFASKDIPWAMACSPALLAVCTFLTVALRHKGQVRALLVAYSCALPIQFVVLRLGPNTTTESAWLSQAIATAVVVILLASVYRNVYPRLPRRPTAA